jgi:hypothetical protein
MLSDDEIWSVLISSVTLASALIAATRGAVTPDTPSATIVSSSWRVSGSPMSTPSEGGFSQPITREMPACAAYRGCSAGSVAAANASRPASSPSPSIGPSALMTPRSVMSRGAYRVLPADLSWKEAVIALARAIEREARRQALEDAALACECIADDYYEREGLKWPEMRHDAQQGSLDCADAIRALKEETK